MYFYNSLKKNEEEILQNLFILQKEYSEYLKKIMIFCYHLGDVDYTWHIHTGCIYHLEKIFITY